MEGYGTKQGNMGVGAELGATSRGVGALQEGDGVDKGVDNCGGGECHVPPKFNLYMRGRFWRSPE